MKLTREELLAAAAAAGPKPKQQQCTDEEFCELFDGYQVVCADRARARHSLTELRALLAEARDAMDFMQVVNSNDFRRIDDLRQRLDAALGKERGA